MNEAFELDPTTVRNVFLIVFLVAAMVIILVRTYAGKWTSTIRNLFICVTIIVIGITGIISKGIANLQAMLSILTLMIPSVVTMTILGHCIGSIMDNPKNKEDAAYKLDVLNALKSMDKSMTMEELNEKLTAVTKEPDLPEEPQEDETET